MKRRILFVDDDPNLLQGLKRMLRSMRDEWEMEFAPGGHEALACLERAAFDVVVSDVRMPMMNGVQLLTDIQSRYPQTIRILLSGQADQEMTMSAIGPAHQYLAKPCDADELKTTIDRVCTLGDLLGDERLKQVVSQIESMPVIPALYLELEEELQSSDSSIAKAAAIISKDVGMTAKILQMVNSAFFGIPQSISDPSQAVLFLGLDTLKTLVLSVQVFQQLGQNLVSGFSYERFWHHSLSTGEHAQKIIKAEKGEPRMVGEALAGGLLHDIGVLILASHLPERYQETLRLAESHQLSREDAEQETLGTTHAEIGAYLLGIWGLNTPIVEAVAFHHHPARSLLQTLAPVTAVHVANALADIGEGPKEEVPPNIDLDYLAQLGLADRLPVWRSLVEVPVEK